LLGLGADGAGPAAPVVQFMGLPDASPDSPKDVGSALVGAGASVDGTGGSVAADRREPASARNPSWPFLDGDRGRVGWRRVAVLGGALAVAVVVVVVLAVVRSGGAGGAPPAPRRQVVDRPTGLVELTAAAWPTGPVGECLVQIPGRSVLEPIDCGQPHDLERVAAGTLPPGIDAAALCTSAAVEYLGEPPAGAGMSVSSTHPSPAGRAAGDRTYQCWIGVPGHRSITAVTTGVRPRL